MGTLMTDELTKMLSFSSGELLVGAWEGGKLGGAKPDAASEGRSRT